MDLIDFAVDNWIIILSYVASLMVAATFLMKTMIPLRRIAIVSNVLFMIFGFFSGNYAILFLHAFLFPLNIYRLYQMQQLIEKVEASSTGDFNFEWLIPYMKREEVAPGATIFKKGDPADKIYYISAGRLNLVEIEKTIGKGSILGEMGVFSPNSKRTLTAKAEKDIELFFITREKVMELYHQNPKFGFFMVQLLVRRFIENKEVHEATYHKDVQEFDKEQG